MKVIVNYSETGRDRGKKGEERLRVQKIKKLQWMETNVWPWWIRCETEAHHWAATLVNRDVQGGQCDGLFWRHSRGEWLKFGGPRAQLELDEYELPWIQAYGLPAMKDALRGTEDAYQSSLARNDTLASLTDEANQKGRAIAAVKVKARCAKRQRTDP